LAKLAFIMNVNNSSWTKLKSFSLFSVKRLLDKSYKAVTACLVFSLPVILTGCGNDGGGSHADDKVKLKTITAMISHSSFAFSNNGSIYAVGFNERGQLGLGDNNNRNTFTEVTGLRDKNIISIATIETFTLALSNDGKVYAAGSNSAGQLGLGDNVNHNVFTEVTDLRDKNIVSISAGRGHSIVLGKDGKVYAAGSNDNGELGLGNNINRNFFTEVTGLRDKNITSIGAGEAFTLALSNDGKVYAAGLNSAGQLGLGDNVNRSVFAEVTDLRDKNITSIGMGRYHSFVLGNDGKVYATGSNDNGQLGFGNNTSRNLFTEVTGLRDKNITSIVGGSQHSLALGKDGEVYAVGLNDAGQLGLGDNNNRNTFTEATYLRDKNITSIVAGEAIALAFSNNDKVYSTGWNGFGQLGLGDNNNRNTFTEVTLP
jgi:alpha-tubulin suppressor-like RCC1 family protein